MRVACATLAFLAFTSHLGADDRCLLLRPRGWLDHVELIEGKSTGKAPACWWSEDALRHFLANADLVVVATVTFEPVGSSWGGARPFHGKCEVNVSEVFKGDHPQGKALEVTLFWAWDGKPPPLKKGESCALFLQRHPGGQPGWYPAGWFGMQRSSPGMVQALRKAAKAK